MTKKYYWALAVAAAFVAGTMTTGGVVYAGLDQCSNDPPQGISDGKPFLEIWQAICDLETQVGNDNDTDPTNELGPVLGFYDVSQGYTATDEDEGNQSVAVQASCDLGDVAVSVTYGFNNDSINVDETATFNVVVGHVEFINILEGDLLSMTTLCADFALVHVP